MTDCIVREENGTTWIMLQGRLDSMTSPSVQQQMDQLIIDGKRLLVVDMSDVGFVSSAGLRVFMIAQKQLKKVGGEIILYGVSESIQKIFKMSGFEALLRMCSSRQELTAMLADSKCPATQQEAEAYGIRFRYVKNSVLPGTCFPIGEQKKLAQSRYEFQDVVSVKQSDIQYGTGLAAVGDEYEDYKAFFGEALIINRHFFCYPAVKRPAVDFILCTEQDPTMEYKFLHGFSFKGQFSIVASFEGSRDFPTLDALVEGLFTLTAVPAIGLVILAESKGLLGMNLKKVPLFENEPQNKLEIFDVANFAEWMNFPIEPTDANNIIAAVGIAVRSREGLATMFQNILSKDSPHHIHGGVFAKEPLSKDPARFENELGRVLTELQATKVQHVLGQSKFSNGLVGIIEL